MWKCFQALVGNAIYLDRGYIPTSSSWKSGIIKPYPESGEAVAEGSQLQVETDWIGDRKTNSLIEFNLLEQTVDEQQNPVFEHTGRGRTGCWGKAKDIQERITAGSRSWNLNKIKNDPQFIDTIFGRKAQWEQVCRRESTSVDATDALTAEAEYSSLAQAGRAEPGIFRYGSERRNHWLLRNTMTWTIIAETEEAAFQLTEETETDREETKYYVVIAWLPP